MCIGAEDLNVVAMNVSISMDYKIAINVVCARAKFH